MLGTVWTKLKRSYLIGFFTSDNVTLLWRAFISSNDACQKSVIHECLFTLLLFQLGSNLICLAFKHWEQAVF